jgi:hypothetical protein
VELIFTVAVSAGAILKHNATSNAIKIPRTQREVIATGFEAGKLILDMPRLPPRPVDGEPSNAVPCISLRRWMGTLISAKAPALTVEKGKSNMANETGLPEKYRIPFRPASRTPACMVVPAKRGSPLVFGIDPERREADFSYASQ